MKSIYIWNTKNFPYGEKNRRNNKRFTIQNVEYLIKKKCKNNNSLWNCNKSNNRYITTKFEIPIIGIIKPNSSHIKRKKSTKK